MKFDKIYLKNCFRKYYTDLTNKTRANFVTIWIICDYVYHFGTQTMVKKAWKSQTVKPEPGSLATLYIFTL